MKYYELVNLVEKHTYLKNKYDVVCFLVGYKGTVNEQDLDNISRLYADGFVK